MPGAATRKTGAGQNLNRGFDQRKGLPRDERSGDVVRGLLPAADPDRHASERSRQLLRHVERASIAFDREKDAFELGNAASGECLHGMERARGRSEASERGQRGAIQRSTGVQKDFPAARFPAESGDRPSDGSKRTVRRSQ